MKFCILLFTFGYILEFCSGQKRLYYTGSFRNFEVNSVAFAANRLLHADIFQHNRKGEFVPDFNHSILFSGQTFARLKHVNVSLDDELLNSLRSHVTSDLSGFTLLSAAFYKQVSAYDYGMAMLSSTSDQTLNDYVLEAEIGLYDHAIDQFLERYWREISGGDLIAVSASVKTDKHAASTIGSDEIEMSNIQDQQQPQLQQHEMTFTRDFMGRVSALSHTWRSEDSTNGNSQNGQQCEASGFVSDGVPLRVMTYNLWHNNPPSWVYRDQSARWKRYERRLRHFAEVVAAEDPDVITLQEVRHDSAFTANSRKTRHWNDLTQEKDDAGAQVEHLLSHLASARQRLAESRGENSSAGRAATDKNYYQYVSHPAMAMLERTRLIYRNEEGLLILSKLPITDSDVLFLPRNIGDASDDHQRIVLRVSVELPLPTGCSGDPVTVDVMTSHLSLSPTARDLAAAEIVHFASCPAIGTSGHVYRPSPIQVLTGDFNAEPHEPAVQYLLDHANYVAVKCPMVDDEFAGEVSPTAFVDSWQEHSQRSATTTSPAAAEIEVDAMGSIHRSNSSFPTIAGGDPGFTFPSCNPIKRIDFVLVRNATAPSDKGQGRWSATVTIANSYIVGTKPTKDTEHLMNSREGLGMNDQDSPIWASDHFAVVSDLLVAFQSDA